MKDKKAVMKKGEVPRYIHEPLPEGEGGKGAAALRIFGGFFRLCVTIATPLLMLLFICSVLSIPFALPEFIGMTVLLSLACVLCSKPRWLLVLMPFFTALLYWARVLRPEYWEKAGKELFVPNAILYSFSRIVDLAFARLREFGYAVPSDEMTPPMPGVTLDALTAGGMLMLIFVIVMLTVPFLYRKTILAPPLLTGVCLCVAAFTFVPGNNPILFGALIAVLCALLVQHRFEKTYTVKGEKFSRQTALRASYPAALTLLLVILLMLPPAMTLREPWKDIPLISGPIETIHQTAARIFSGEIRLFPGGTSEGAVDYEGNRSVTAEKRTFRNREILKVWSPVNRPVYLRSWIGMTCEEGNQWLPVNTYPDYSVFLNIFGSDFCPEQLTDAFYRLMAPLGEDARPIEEDSDVRYNPTLGYLKSNIWIRELTSSGQLLYLPSVFDASSSFAFLTLPEAIEYAVPVGEGLFTCSAPLGTRYYRSTAYLPVYGSEKYGKKLQDMIESYQEIIPLVQYWFQKNAEKGGGYTLKEMEEDLYQEALTLEVIGTDSNGEILYGTNEWADIRLLYFRNSNLTPLTEFMSWTLEEQSDFMYLTQFVRLNYEEWVRQNYSSYPGTFAFRQVFNQIMEELFPSVLRKGSYRMAQTSSNIYRTARYYLNRAGIDDHTIILTLLRYLDTHYRYTLDPKPSEDPTLSALDAFLSETREGYCVQFATSAALLLRAMGFQTRYVEGYYADAFKLDSSDSAPARYAASVPDSSAHAWIEVYFSGVGFLPYEATAVYSDAFLDEINVVIVDPEPYRPSTTGEETTSPVSGEETTKSPVMTDPSGETTDPAQPPQSKPFALPRAALILIPIVTVIALTAVILILLRKKRVATREKLYQMANTALSDPAAAALGKELSKRILVLCRLRRLNPGSAEMPTAFAARVAEARRLVHGEESASEVTEVFRLLEKTAFGPVPTREELTKLAAFASVYEQETASALSGTRVFLEKYLTGRL